MTSAYVERLTWFNRPAISANEYITRKYRRSCTKTPGSCSSVDDRLPLRDMTTTVTPSTTIASVVSMNGAPRIAPVPISSPVSWPDRIATSGSNVSGRAVPTAASTDPTAPSDNPKPSPIHSMPFVNSSAPARMTISDAARSAQTIGGLSHPSATVNASKGSSPTRATPSSRSRTAARRPSAVAGTRPSGHRLEVSPLTLPDELTDIHPSRQRLALALAIGAAVPALIVRVLAPELPHLRPRPRSSVWRSWARRSSSRGRRRSRSWTSPPAWRSPCWRSSPSSPSTRSTSSSRGRAGTRSRRPVRRACRSPEAGPSRHAGSRSRT